MMPTPTLHVLLDVASERRKQDERWGVQAHTPERWLSILVEEVGEVAKEIAEGCKDLEAYREELVQVTAVAVAAIETIDVGAAGFELRAA